MKYAIYEQNRYTYATLKVHTTTSWSDVPILVKKMINALSPHPSGNHCALLVDVQICGIWGLLLLLEIACGFNKLSFRIWANWIIHYIIQSSFGFTLWKTWHKNTLIDSSTLAFLCIKKLWMINSLILMIAKIY